MKHKTYQEIIIKTIPFVPELISGTVLLFNANGIEERENELVCYFDDFDDNDLSLLKKLLGNLQTESLIERFEVYQTSITHKNWNEEWEKTIQPIKVSDKIIIKPSFREYEKQKNEIVITIDPKMSFGTGYHQTTRIILRLIEKYVFDGAKVLDVGTGTGILAIAAIKFGADHAIACDNDEFVQENVYENFEKNEVNEKCKFILGSIFDIKENNFDLVLVNIQKNVILEIADEIKRKTKVNGIVILSGLLETDKQEVLGEFNSLGFELIELLSEDEWIGLVFKNLSVAFKD